MSRHMADLSTQNFFSWTKQVPLCHVPVNSISVQVSPLPLLLNSLTAGEMHEEEQTNSYQIHSVESEREHSAIS